MFKKALLTSVLLFSSSHSFALDFNNNYCDPTTGNISAVISISVWDALFHKKVIVKAKEKYTENWSEIELNLGYPGGTFDTNTYDIGLIYPATDYSISTNKGLLFEGECS